ncbi:MAG: DNA-processing protein DprA [Candidatus Pacebacteria bacterium]|nr:DNA-processing protein DprA [Candidatus Paceibacterota bacterium]MDD5357417.1 DNA-processing protein DprA [Candidatus Paceibacterota bacterium]
MDNKIQKIGPKDFPPLLREINDPPKKLYVKGTLPDWKENMFLAVVGARKYTSYGKEACEKLIAGLRGYPIVIVSGLALGIDSIAHRAALDAGLKTIAVPGSGLGPEFIYPRSHVALAEKIVESGGALLSEFEPKTPGYPKNFPQRNRIMAGMTHATLVVEAEIRSGTLITSKFAIEYNRDVLTIPGSIFSKTSEGPHMLLRLGATPITTSEELLEALGFEQDEETRTQVLFADASPEEQIILNFLVEPMTRDELIRTCGKSTSEMNVLLSGMEIKGMIKESLGELRKT